VPQIFDILPESRPPLLWIHGDDDKLVSNQSASDSGSQGKLGLIPDWPGDSIFPPQPMFNQIKHFVEDYHHKNNTKTILLNGIGHCPQVEDPKLVAGIILGENS